jgi:diguanylate cyclase (GGDEF)-like protein
LGETDVERETRTVLALEGVVLPASLRAQGLELSIRTAAGPLDAARSLAMEPSFILFRADSSWQRGFVARLPEDRRPAAIAVGPLPGTSAHLADEWLAPLTSAEEIFSRLQLADRRARARRRLARRGFVDGLTALPNRRAVVRALVRERDRTRRSGGTLSLVLIDLDGFKRVNEERGHDEGDRLLRRVGTVLRRGVRAPELCGRIGGDEFAIVVAGDRPEAVRVAQRVRTALAEIGVSATTATHELAPGQSLKSLYRAADAQLRAAKRRPPEPARPEGALIEIDPRSAMGITFPTHQREG